MRLRAHDATAIARMARAMPSPEVTFLGQVAVTQTTLSAVLNACGRS
jgi:hypothetical protein